MLYLNVVLVLTQPLKYHLTLTSVVFELIWDEAIREKAINLTLTSVVFEFNSASNDTQRILFNFNKCCI